MSQQRSQRVSHARSAIALGLLVTALCALATSGGVFSWLERLTVDVRYRHARLRPEPMAPAICHVDIDDGALESEGRWPWPRTWLGQVIEELDRAGARTVALDILMENPTEPEYQPLRGETGLIVLDARGEPVTERVDHDENLAGAIAGAENVVLGVDIDDTRPLSDAWYSPAGRAELVRVLDLLKGDITVQTPVVLRRAKLTGPRPERFERARPKFNRIAAWEVAWELGAGGEEEVTLEALMRAAAPSVDAQTDFFPQLPTLRHTVQQYESWRLLRERGALTGGRGDHSIYHKAPPAAFSEGAMGAGFVSAEPDPDGAVRRIPVARATVGGRVLQMGVAAAAHYLGVAPADVVVSPTEVRIGEVRLPLRGGRLLVDWPRPLAGGAMEDGWIRALEQSPADLPGTGHLSIGTIRRLGRDRETLERLEREFRLASQKIQEKLILDDEEASDAAALAREVALEVRLNILMAAQASDPAGWAEQPEDVRALLEGGQAEAEQPVPVREALHVLASEVASAQDRETREMFVSYLQWDRIDRDLVTTRALLAEGEAALRGQVEGKLVFVGWTATGALADFIRSPLDPRTPGVMVHSCVANMLLSGNFRGEAPAWFGPVIVLLVGAAISFATGGLNTIWSTVAAFAVMGLYTAVAGVWAFSELRVIQPVVAPLLAGVAAWASVTALEAFLNERARERLTRQFKARVSGDLVDYLLEHPDAVSRSGEQRDLSVLFLDLAGFTSISEKLDGPRTVALLNTCMRSMTNILTLEQAYVNKFLGDGLMAFWSAFQETPNQADRACRAALACQMSLDALNETPQFEGLPRISSRIGIATGMAIVGDCGAPPELNDYTAIGDTVNLAARLESANKQFGTRIMIDGRTRALLSDTSMHVRPLGRVTVVGQTTPTLVYEVLSGDADPDIVPMTEAAVNAFMDGDYDKSAAAWRRLTERFGPSPVAEMYLEAMADAGAVLGGVLRLKAK